MQFPQNTPIEKKGLKKWIGNLMPDYSLKVKNKAQLEKLLASEGDINKVVLLTTKKAPASVFKGVVSEFRNRLRFYMITLDSEDSEEAVALKEALGVESSPAIVAIQTYDSALDKLVAESTVPFTEKTTFENLVNFLTPLAREDLKAESAEAREEKEEQVADGEASEAALEELTAQDLDKKVFSSRQAAVVYYTQLTADEDVRTEWRSIKKFARAMKDMVNLFVVRVTDEDKLPAGKLMFYPNLEIGKAKKRGERELTLNRDSKEVVKLVEQVSEELDARYDLIRSDMFQQWIIQHSQIE